jgi:hypothetical protein
VFARQEEAKMDRLSVLRQDIQRISGRCDLLAFLFGASLARGQFTPGTPKFVPQDCHKFDCGEPTEHQLSVPRTDLFKNGARALKQALVGNSYILRAERVEVQLWLHSGCTEVNGVFTAHYNWGHDRRNFSAIVIRCALQYRAALTNITF